MKYTQKIVLKDGKEAYLRNGVASDGNAVFENFNLTHLYTKPDKWQVRKGDEWEIKSVNRRKKVVTLTKYEHDRLIMKLTFDMFEKYFEEKDYIKLTSDDGVFPETPKPEVYHEEFGYLCR